MPEGIKPVGKPTLLATPICYKYKTVLAPTLSECSPTARMSGKPFCDTTRVWTEALGSGNAPRWFLSKSFNKHKKYDKLNSKISFRFIPLSRLNHIAFNGWLAHCQSLPRALCLYHLRQSWHGILVYSHRSLCLYKT